MGAESIGRRHFWRGAGALGIGLALAAVAPLPAAAREEPDTPFVSDGCTLFPDGDYGDCCIEHDRIYWRGGTRGERRRADRELCRCVAAHGRAVLGRLMYAMVRIGGVPWLPTPWRWGFGYTWPRRSGYDADGPAGPPNPRL